MGVRGLLVHVHREMHHVRFPELLAAEPERVLEEVPYLVVARALEELWACRHDALDEPHGILAHLAGTLVARVNPRLNLALVVGVRAQLSVHPGSGLVYVRVRVLSRLAVVVVLHGAYLGTLALLDSKDCVLLTHRRRHLLAFGTKG